MTTNKSVNFTVNGMHCGGCANKIKKSIEGLNVEHTIDVNVDNKKVSIKFNSEQINIGSLKDSIAQAGFQVESVELE